MEIKVLIKISQNNLIIILKFLEPHKNLKKIVVLLEVLLKKLENQCKVKVKEIANNRIVCLKLQKILILDLDILCKIKRNKI